MSFYAFNNSNFGDNSSPNSGGKKMNIEKLLDENLETFYPWSDSENPPLDANKNFVQWQREMDENFEGWRASM